MAFVPFDDCVSVSICATYSGQTVCITLGYCKDAFDGDDVDALFTALETWIQDELAPLLTNDVTFNTMVITDLRSDTAPSYEFGLSTPGLDTNAPLPNNVALVVTFDTALRGRSYRGRNYVFGFSQGDITTPTQATTAFTGELADAYVAMNVLATAAGWTHVVLSRFADGVQRETGVATPVEGYRVGDFLDSQRRRLAGRGD